MFGHRKLTHEDYLGILRRRWWVVVLPVLVVPVLAYAIAQRLPRKYTSESLLLIEGQTVPDAFVKPVFSEYLNVRVGAIKERIFSRSQLQKLIQTVGQSEPEILRQSPASLRKTISITLAPSLTSADDRDSPGFYVSVVLGSPRLAQNVCARITSLFVEQAMQEEQHSAHETGRFLDDQIGESKRNLDEQDERLAQFNSRYIGALPEDREANLNMLTASSNQLASVMEALRQAQENKAYTESLLKQELAAWQASKKGTGDVSRPEIFEKQLAEKEETLQSLRAQFTDEYPEIVRLKAQIEKLRNQAREAASRPNKQDSESQDPGIVEHASILEPVAVQQLRREIRAGELSIGERLREKQRLEKQIQTYESRVQLSPEAEREHLQVTRDRQTALEFYNQLLKSQKQSEMNADLESGHGGMHFQIMDPASLPTEPTSPEPLKLAAAGLVGGLGLGLAIALLLEFSDRSLRTDDDVQTCLRVPVFVSVPRIESLKTSRRALAGTRTLQLAIPESNGTTTRGYASRASDSAAIERVTPIGRASLADRPKAEYALGEGGRAREYASAASILAENAAPPNDQIPFEDVVQNEWRPDRSLLFSVGQGSKPGTEEFRTLRTQLHLVRQKQVLQKLLITSSLPLEGKSFTTMNLAYAMAEQREERILLIDCDLRRPRLHETLGAPISPGLTDYILGGVDWPSVVQRGTLDNLFVITAGTPVENPSEIIAHRRLSLLLHDLESSYDWIILDSPPVVPVSDAKFLAELADAVLLLVRAGTTSVELAQKACQQFRPERLLGVVLNCAPPNPSYASYYGQKNK